MQFACICKAHDRISTSSYIMCRRLRIQRIPLEKQEKALIFMSNNGKKLILRVLMHTADISNVCRPGNTSMVWGSRLNEEFQRQGDTEKANRLPVKASRNPDTDAWEFTMTGGGLVSALSGVRKRRLSVPSSGGGCGAAVDLLGERLPPVVPPVLRERRCIPLKPQAEESWATDSTPQSGLRCIGAR